MGKTSLLDRTYANARRIDLLKGAEFKRVAGDIGYLRQLVNANPGGLTVIDEVQKLPELLDEVQSLIDERGALFCLCGSSARKLKRDGGNLLGGRARRYELHGLVASELGEAFDLSRLLNFGNLPSHYLSDDPQADLDAYVGDYLQEEIAAEALVRNLPKFVDFLRAAAIGDTEIVDYTKIASECGVSVPSVKNHFNILEDTLLGFTLPAYVRRQKRRVLHSPKFYFANVGVVNNLAKRRQVEAGSEVFGKAFENWLVNEIRTYNTYRKKRWDLSYWRLASGGEVDIVVNDGEYAFEIKGSRRITGQHLKGLRSFAEDNPSVSSRSVICLEEKVLRTDDGIDVLPYREFLSRLWSDAW